MHGTTLAAEPPFTYWSSESLRAMECVRMLRKRIGLLFHDGCWSQCQSFMPKQEEQTILRELCSLCLRTISNCSCGQRISLLPVEESSPSTKKPLRSHRLGVSK